LLRELYLVHCKALLVLSGAIPVVYVLTLILLTWSIGWARNYASKWQMGFNWAFKGLIGWGRSVKHNTVCYYIF
jgi:hypothetical protein